MIILVFSWESCDIHQLNPQNIHKTFGAHVLGKFKNFFPPLPRTPLFSIHDFPLSLSLVSTHPIVELSLFVVNFLSCILSSPPAQLTAVQSLLVLVLTFSHMPATRLRFTQHNTHVDVPPSPLLKNSNNGKPTVSEQTHNETFPR